MASTLKTGLQFLGTSGGFRLLGALCALPLEDNTNLVSLSYFKTAPVSLSHLQTALYYGSALFWLLAAATGLVAAIYLVSSVIEGIGRLLWKDKQSTSTDD